MPEHRQTKGSVSKSRSLRSSSSDLRICLSVSLPKPPEARPTDQTPKTPTVESVDPLPLSLAHFVTHDGEEEEEEVKWSASTDRPNPPPRLLARPIILVIGVSAPGRWAQSG